MSAHLIPMVPGTINSPLTLDLSRVVVRRQQQTLKTIKSLVAAAYGVSMKQMDSRRRVAHIAWARQVAMHLCRELGDASLCDVAREFGRDFRTVWFASTHVHNLMDTDSRVREQIQRLQAQVRGL